MQPLICLTFVSCFQLNAYFDMAVSAGLLQCTARKTVYALLT